MTPREAVLHRLSLFARPLVALSGGIDSALLAVLATRHAQQALCVTVDSPFLAKRDLQDAQALAAKFQLNLRILPLDPLADPVLGPEIHANPENRCYFCKRFILHALQQIASGEGYDAVLSGDNADDIHQIRPGTRALDEAAVVRPLQEAGLTKHEIRQWAKELEIPLWEKPAGACLASRIPFGTSIKPEELRRIEQAENALHELGFRVLRVRSYGTTACIETSPEEMPLILQHRDAILTRLCEAGYFSITLDLGGYQCGNLHRA